MRVVRNVGGEIQKNIRYRKAEPLPLLKDEQEHAQWQMCWLCGKNAIEDDGTPEAEMPVGSGVLAAHRDCRNAWAWVKRPVMASVMGWPKPSDDLLHLAYSKQEQDSTA